MPHQSKIITSVLCYLNSKVFVHKMFAIAGPISPVEISAVLLPQSGDPVPDNLTKWLLEALLTYSVSEVLLKSSYYFVFLLKFN